MKRECLMEMIDSTFPICSSNEGPWLNNACLTVSALRASPEDHSVRMCLTNGPDYVRLGETRKHTAASSIATKSIIVPFIQSTPRVAAHSISRSQKQRRKIDADR